MTEIHIWQENRQKFCENNLYGKYLTKGLCMKDKRDNMNLGNFVGIPQINIQSEENQRFGL